MEEIKNRVSLYLSEEAMEAEKIVAALHDVETKRKQRYDIAIIALAQIIKARSEGDNKLKAIDINLRAIPKDPEVN